MKLATWNVNSLNVRLQHVLDWVGAHPVDVLCLQETKLTDDKFPLAPLGQAGYQAVYAGQKTYNGVAILARHEIADVVRNIPGYIDDQQRVIAATVAAPGGAVRVVNAYFPNGQEVGSDKYRYKLDWCAALREYVAAEAARHPRFALLGDYNIAPEDRDVHDPVAWAGQVLCSEPERACFRALIELGLKDTFRLFEQPEKSYSWWDYRQLGFQKNKGLRIDHILASPALAESCQACTIDRAERKKPQPSDHAPVVATFG